MKIERAIASYLLDCRSGLKPETCHIYKLALRRIARYLAHHKIKRIEDIQPDHVRDFIARVQLGDFRDVGSGPVSDNTVHQHYRSLATWFQWLVREGRLDQSPMANVRAPVQPQASTQYLTAPDIDRLLAAIEKTKSPVRDRAIVLLFLDTGLRRQELANLTPDDIDWNQYTVTVKVGKMGKGRMVPMSSQAWTALMAWMEIRPERPTLFGLGSQNIYQIFYRLRRRFPELGRVSPHKLRHTFGTYYAGDIKDISLLMGHADVNTTARIYCHRQALALVALHEDRTPLRMVKPLLPEKPAV